jgi:glucose-1-phosphatase
MIRGNYPLLQHFHTLILSHEVGAMKPSPLIYQKAVEAAGCLPEECFFTDDIQEYVDGARLYGIDAVRFESQKQIEAELRKRITLD